MKRIVLCSVLAVSLARGQGIQQLSLEDALRIGRENSKALRIAGLRVDAASAKSGEANTALLPSIKFEGSYKRQSDIGTSAVSVPFLPSPIVISPDITNAYYLRLGLQQPLFTGFKLISNARAAARLAEASEADRRESEADVTLSISTAYWMLYQAIETAKYVDENVDRLSSYVEDTQNLMKAGLVTRNDFLKIQVQLSNARLSQIDAANDVEVATMRLDNVMGQSVDSLIHPVSTPEVPESGGADSSRVMAEAPAALLLDRAMSNRPDLLAMNNRVEASRAGATAARGGWWPQIALTANYFYSRPNQRFLPLQDEFKGTWEVGIAMQLDVWNWGATLFQTEQSLSQVSQNEELLEQMRDNATLEVRKNQLDVRRAAKRIDVAREAIEQAEENSRSINEKYRNGLATSTDLLDASLAVLQAKTSYTGALVEHQIALARLDKSIGK